MSDALHIDVPGDRSASTGSEADAHDAWLSQARKTRDAALCLLRDRFASDLEAAAQLIGRDRPRAVALQADYATQLTANYLAESEKLFESMSRLARTDRTATPGAATALAARKRRQVKASKL